MRKILYSALLYTFALQAQEAEKKITIPAEIKKESISFEKDPLMPLLPPVDELINPKSFKDYIEKPSFEIKRLNWFAPNPSWTMQRATLYMMANDSAASASDKMIIRAFKNTNSRAYVKNAGPAALYSGVLDPVEAIRAYKMELRRQRTKRIIETLNRLDTIR